MVITKVGTDGLLKLLGLNADDISWNFLGDRQVEIIVVIFIHLEFIHVPFLHRVTPVERDYEFRIRWRLGHCGPEILFDTIK